MLSPKDHMERFARRVPGGGIAWENAIFSTDESDPGKLLDAAVDIAWERLVEGARGLRPTRLDINRQGRLLVFRLAGQPTQSELPLAWN
ncbi:MAG: hypothetical protein HKN29_03380 [Rhodothermales bacterium]|nr:hypothetical protein [Rhodothermales bacterium]